MCALPSGERRTIKSHLLNREGVHFSGAEHIAHAEQEVLDLRTQSTESSNGRKPPSGALGVQCLPLKDLPLLWVMKSLRFLAPTNSLGCALGPAESSLRPRGDEMQALVATRARGQVELLQL